MVSLVLPQPLRQLQRKRRRQRPLEQEHSQQAATSVRVLVKGLTYVRPRSRRRPRRRPRCSQLWARGTSAASSASRWGGSPCPVSQRPEGRGRARGSKRGLSLRRTAVQKLRIVLVGLGAGRQKTALERWTNPMQTFAACVNMRVRATILERGIGGRRETAA